MPRGYYSSKSGTLPFVHCPFCKPSTLNPDNLSDGDVLGMTGTGLNFIRDGSRAEAGVESREVPGNSCMASEFTRKTHQLRKLSRCSLRAIPTLESYSILN